MQWKKLGRIYAPSGQNGWDRSYAVFPTVDPVGNGLLRIYFASLDENHHGRAGYVEISESDTTQIKSVASKPVLDLGEIGAFDDCGVNPFSIVNFGGRKLMYYQGWQRTERVPYLLFTGLAISEDGGKTFHRHERVPVLDRTDAEPFIRGAPCVLEEKGMLRMWYASGSRWTIESTGPRYDVAIRHAQSKDGIHWEASPEICVAPIAPDEYAVGRPAVLFDGQKYRMWYSMRSVSKLYVIGYAESPDGLKWKRMDSRAGIEKSPEGWDSSMICYPAIHRTKSKLLLFYNGNRHGESGFGCAEMPWPPKP